MCKLLIINHFTTRHCEEERRSNLCATGSQPNTGGFCKTFKELFLSLLLQSRNWGGVKVRLLKKAFCFKLSALPCNMQYTQNHSLLQAFKAINQPLRIFHRRILRQARVIGRFTQIQIQSIQCRRFGVRPAGNLYLR